MRLSPICLLLVGLLTVVVVAKPLDQQVSLQPKATTDNHKDKADPLVALPSDASQHQTVIYEQAHDPSSTHRTEIQYVYQAQPDTTYTHEVPQTVEAPSPARQTMFTVQPGQYILQGHQGQQADDKSVDGQTSTDCVQSHEYASLASLMSQPQQPIRQQQQQQQQAPPNAQSDYQGEVIYMSPEGETVSAREANLGQSVSQSVAQASGLPATILTEVPANEMPREGKFPCRFEYCLHILVID